MTTQYGQELVTSLMEKCDDYRKRSEHIEKQYNLLRKQYDELKNKEKREEEKKDATCQTNLDLMNINELVKASITLKRQNEEQKGQQKLLEQQQQQIQHQEEQLEQLHQQIEQQQRIIEQQQQQQQLQHQQQLQQQQQQSHYPHQQIPNFSELNTMQSITYMTDKSFENDPKPVVTQLHYPNVTLPKQVPEIDTLKPQEKQILEELYKLDGSVTTIFHKIRAVSNKG